MTDKPETVLDEANRLIYGDRNKDYGHPLDNFQHIADMVNARFSSYFKEARGFSAEDIADIMILVKLSRDANVPKRDNLTDICGYAGCKQRIRDRLAGLE